MPTKRIADLTLAGQSEETLYGTIESLTATPLTVQQGRLTLLPLSKGA